MSVSLSGSFTWKNENDPVVDNFLKWYKDHSEELSEDSRMVINNVFLNTHNDNDDEYVIDCYSISSTGFYYGCTYGRHFEPFDELIKIISMCSPDVIFTEDNFADCDWYERRYFIWKNGTIIDTYEHILACWLPDKTVYSCSKDGQLHPTDEHPSGYFYCNEDGYHEISESEFNAMIEEFNNTPDEITPIWG